MSHWKTAENKSQKKRHKRKGVMTKKQLKEFFGHTFSPLDTTKPVMYSITLGKTDEEKSTKYDIYFDKNNQLCDIIPETPQSHEFLNMFRGNPLDTVVFELNYSN